MARPQRLSDHSYTGIQRYFLTICTHHRTELFRDKDVVDAVVDHFLQTAREHDVAIVAYCVMPDHVHLLVDGERDDSDLTRFVKIAKQRAGYWFKQRVGKRLWQKGYYEHVLRNDERTEAVAYYIIANPVRKHLVERPEEYPYWGSAVYSREDLLSSIGGRGA
jgi:putative transposase